MDFLVYSRGLPAAAHDVELNERHWSYLDRFADRMTARGPTLSMDRQTWTGSLHIVDLPDFEAAREFVAQEPYNQAGLFEGHSVWRFTNILGRTMWQFERGADEPRFLVLARGAEHRATAAPVPVADLPAQLRDRLIVYGSLHDPVDHALAGLALAVQGPDREVLDALVADRQCGIGEYPRVEIHDWEFGGRR